MSDFLSHLVQRALGSGPAVQPFITARPAVAEPALTDNSPDAPSRRPSVSKVRPAVPISMNAGASRVPNEMVSAVDPGISESLPPADRQDIHLDADEKSAVPNKSIMQPDNAPRAARQLSPFPKSTVASGILRGSNVPIVSPDSAVEMTAESTPLQFTAKASSVHSQQEEFLPESTAPSLLMTRQNQAAAVPIDAAPKMPAQMNSAPSLTKHSSAPASSLINVRQGLDQEALPATRVVNSQMEARREILSVDSQVPNVSPDLQKAEAQVKDRRTEDSESVVTQLVDSGFAKPRAAKAPAKETPAASLTLPLRESRWSPDVAESPAATTAPPDVQIRIGRIEVRAAAPSPVPAPAPTRSTPSLSLSDFLKQRRGRS